MLADGVPENVGASGEYYVFQSMKKILPEFVKERWVSELKWHYFRLAKYPERPRR